MSILLACSFDSAEWAAWLPCLHEALPGQTWHRADEAASLTSAQRAAVDVAIVANPRPGQLGGYPGLRLIQSLWAGVDRLLDDSTLPADVALARMVDPAMSSAMAETALWAVLSLHRGFFGYARQQAQAHWHQLEQRRADEVQVLVAGQGELGRHVTQRLHGQGYRVTGWSRTPKLDGVAPDASPAPWSIPSHAPSTSPSPSPSPSAWLASSASTASSPWLLAAGAEAWPALAAQADVVINLLPLTPATRGFFDAARLAGLRRGAGFVNLARGAAVVDADLLGALDSGQIGHAVLDVFQHEPLDPAHPYWRHPAVTVLPHVAALTDPRSAARIAAANVQALRASIAADATARAASLPVATLVGRVDRQRGY
jgi:glyoxylate/hydroxypyruvate reductase A